MLNKVTIVFNNLPSFAALCPESLVEICVLFNSVKFWLGWSYRWLSCTFVGIIIILSF